MACRANRHMVIVAPEADLVTRLDPERVSQLLGDDDLALGSDAVGHTDKYNYGSLRTVFAVSSSAVASVTGSPRIQNQTPTAAAARPTVGSGVSSSSRRDTDRWRCR